MSKKPLTGQKFTVNTYSGYKGDERSTSFTLAERIFQVREIIDRWYGEDHAYSKLIADDGNIYSIRHDVENDTWKLVVTETFKAGMDDN